MSNKTITELGLISQFFDESDSEFSDDSEDTIFQIVDSDYERYLIKIRRKMIDTPDTADEELKPLISTKDSLTFIERVAYGFGHVYNDLCAAMWFSYLLFYLQIVLQMESSAAGVLLMIGQISDALATPVAGWAVDRFGTRVSWHFLGTLMVVISFPLVFTACNFCSEENESSNTLYHVVVIIIFQIGWAVVQISHLSMIPNLTSNTARRSELTAIRYTAAVCSSVIAYVITWLVLRSNNVDNYTIGPQDYYKFKEIIVIIIVIGVVTSVVFYSGIRWKRHNVKQSYNKQSIINVPLKQILLAPLIYQISLLYVASRLYMTLNLVYMPLYLDERVTANATTTENLRESLASVPLVSFIASFITSLILKNRTEQWNNKIVYFIGSIISFSSCVYLGLYISQTTNVFYVYTVAVLIGTGSSVTIISSLCLTAEIIGPNINQGASVYSIVTFTDKLICGVVVVVIEYLKCTNKAECPEYYRYVLAYISGGAALFGLLTLLSLYLPERQTSIHEVRNL